MHMKLYLDVTISNCLSDGDGNSGDGITVQTLGVIH